MHNHEHISHRFRSNLNFGHVEHVSHGLGLRKLCLVDVDCINNEQG